MSEVLLRVSHVTKRFGVGAAAVTAVRDVSFTVSRGELVLIMGPSGSGKTTLLSLVGGLLRPTEGTVEMEGEVISALPEDRLPDTRLHRFGFVFQDFNLLPTLTALENVALVAQLAGMGRRGARVRAAALLCDLGLGERLNFRPGKLSGGQKQRTAIARALVNDPLMILADEPTGNLDSKAGYEVARLLWTITKTPSPGSDGCEFKSAIIASHDPRVQDFADRVLRLEDGALKQAPI